MKKKCAIFVRYLVKKVVFLVVLFVRLVQSTSKSIITLNDSLSIYGTPLVFTESAGFEQSVDRDDSQNKVKMKIVN